jgi:membrane associated rhomboid family serine protease
VFVPIYDDNPLKCIRFQYVTVGLIAINTIVFLLQAAGTVQAQVAASFAVVPSELFQAGLWGGAGHGARDIWPIPEGVTLLGYMFFHGDPVHLLGNMLFLWVFGDNVEDALGHLRFLAFYLVSGVAAGLMHAWIVPTSTVPLIGASGAVAGVIAAYLLLHPHVRVWVLAFRVIPLRITAALALGAWILTQVTMLLIPEAGPVAWWAHIGGLLAGAVLVLFLRRPGVPLLGRTPRAI